MKFSVSSSFNYQLEFFFAVDRYNEETGHEKGNRGCSKYIGHLVPRSKVFKCSNFDFQVPNHAILLRLSYLRFVDDECRSFQHGISAFCWNCNFVPETSSAAKTVQLKHERKAGPLIGYLKRFYPGQHARTCDLLFYSTIAFRLGFRTDCNPRVYTRIHGRGKRGGRLFVREKSFRSFHQLRAAF